MLKLESLYKDYVQKSRLFLYPALGMKRGLSVTPIQTYASWQGQYALTDRKLSCIYHVRSDEEFKAFEKFIYNHKMFHDFKLTQDDKGVYVFDFSKQSDDWDMFVKGKYSKLSTDLKRSIRNFFGINNQGYIDSFLFPERYFNMYAEMLSSSREENHHMLKLLQEVGELCSKPDLEKENLIASIKDLHMTNKIT